MHLIADAHQVNATMESHIWTFILLLQGHVSPSSRCSSQLSARHDSTRVTGPWADFLSGHLANWAPNACCSFYPGPVPNHPGVFFA